MKTIVLNSANPYQNLQSYRQYEMVLYNGILKIVNKDIAVGAGVTLLDLDDVVSWNNVTLTGNVNIPTPTDGDNSTLAASTAFVTTAVSNAISAIPSSVSIRGSYNASGNAFPSSGGSGSVGAIKKGDLWTISVAGTLGGTAIKTGDTILALSDSPGQTAGNWLQLSGNLGYVAENISNKDTDTTLSSNSDTKYPSQKAVKTYSDTPLSSVWKVADGTDTTKRVSFDVSNISSSTTRIVTFPNTNVNLGNLPTSLTFSGSTLTLNTVNGSTQTATIPITLAYPQLKAIMLTSNANLIANNVYCISQSITGSKTYTLPSSPADGDTITIYDDNTSSGIAGTLSKTTATAINIASSGAIQLFSSGSGITTTNLLDGFFGPMPIPGFKLVFTYVSATNFWAVRTQFGNNDLFAVPDISFHLMNYTGWTTNPSPTSGWNNKYVAFSATNITSVRTLTFADRNINLDDMKYIPGINTNSSNSTAGSQSAIVAGSSNKTTKQNQCVLVGTLVNADSNCPEDTWIYGNRSTTYSSSKITGYGGIIKGQSLGTATASLVTGSNTKLPAYLTKPSTTHSISMFEFNLSCATDNGKIWCGRRFVCIRWDGSAATTDVQTNGTDYNPDTLTIIFAVSVSGGLLTINVTNSSAGGSENSYWQVTYTAHHNGG